LGRPKQPRSQTALWDVGAHAPTAPPRYRENDRSKLEAAHPACASDLRGWRRLAATKPGLVPPRGNHQRRRFAAAAAGGLRRHHRSSCTGSHWLALSGEHRFWSGTGRLRQGGSCWNPPQPGFHGSAAARPTRPPTWKPRRPCSPQIRFFELNRLVLAEWGWRAPTGSSRHRRLPGVPVLDERPGG